MRLGAWHVRAIFEGGWDLMRLKSRFRWVDLWTRLWRCEALRVRLECNVLLQLGFEEAEYTNRVGQ